MTTTAFTPRTLTEIAHHVPKNRRDAARQVARSINLAYQRGQDNETEAAFAHGAACALATFAGGDHCGTLTIGEIAALPLGDPGCPKCGGWIFENADEDRRYCSRNEAHNLGEVGA